ncbi:MAG: hypothetical protein CMP11_07905 [Zetaproteobacteria bacterium]|nr:hypothetical protein [Pseudobdellovibrionaceae bacterium]|tara:strand:+ start:1625 stop:2197 length:573 start_codon:yes stop_codon:yes gene_type:complete
MIYNFIKKNKALDFINKSNDVFQVRSLSPALREILIIYIIFLLQVLFVWVFSHYSLSIDLLCPWVCFLFVTKSKARSFFLGFVATSFLEAQLVYPAFFFYSSYFSLWLFTTTMRSYVSWKQAFPWVIFLPIAQFWLAFLEILILSLKLNSFDVLLFNHNSSILIRILVTFVAVPLFLKLRIDMETWEEFS